ncbi:uncharacterized protein LOC127087998 isoform X1 [Lathyrus oleraceus]|uniref:Uncharacterized protein n=1 Tax=Pisum sativum TaxID=3888 RepID=A0A9D4WL76_PEA|nr:uncharacterized protein LOC127087998 isoform X1 [Pisum sativum]KAI5402835.1 hypothetical protein KIW84_050435 [Pisum sativum]
MDKTSMKRATTTRTTNRHINKKQQQSGFKKSKKEKLRTLSSMGCNLDHHSHKSISIHKKVFNECNGVDHSSVPRKIRSAMKKRGRESILTDSEKLKYGIESPQKDSIKKSKKQVVLGPITKDEQEVAETLYALAGMFPTNDENELDRESVQKKLSGSQDQDESANVIYEGASEDADVIAESSSKGAVKISSLSEIVEVEVERIDLPGSEDFSVATQNTAPKGNLEGVSMMVKRSENDVKSELHDSELCLGMGLNASAKSQISHIWGKLDEEYETAGGIDCKQEQHIIKYRRENESLTLWPGSSPRESVAINASSSQSSAVAKAPHWLNAAISNSKHDLMESSSSGGKISKTAVHKKSWKSCAAHVHISQLIRSLELPKQQVAKEPELYECDQIRVPRGSTEAQNSNRTRNGNAFASGTVQSASLKNLPESKNGVLQQQCHYLDISLSQASPTPAKHAPQSQSFNFLSLSSGCNGLKVDECLIKGGSRSGPFSKSQVPYFRSIQQQNGLMGAIPTTSNQYTSTSYLDQLPTAGPQVRLQQPHYYGTPLCGTHYSSTNSYKQQYQNIWAAQLVTQGGSGGVNSNLMRVQYPNWQNGRHETSVVNPGVQVMVPYHSLASLESLGSKITSISDQQSFTPPSSIPLSRTNGLEEIRGRFHGSGASSLQLLCDERI